MRVHSWHSCQKRKFQCFQGELRSQLTLWLLGLGPDCLGNPLQSHSPNVFPRIMACWHELEQALPASICVKVAGAFVVEMSWQLQKEPLKEKSSPQGNAWPTCTSSLTCESYQEEILPYPTSHGFFLSHSHSAIWFFFTGLDPPKEFHKLSNEHSLL